MKRRFVEYPLQVKRIDLCGDAVTFCEHLNDYIVEILDGGGDFEAAYKHWEQEFPTANKEEE